MKYCADLVVRSYECDSYGHVNNAVYVNYLEFGRMEYLHQINFDYKGVVAAGYYLYISHIDIHDKLTVEVTPKELRAVSGVFKQVIRKQDGTVCVEAEVTWASVTNDGKLARMPKEFLVPGLIPDPNDFK